MRRRVRGKAGRQQRRAVSRLWPQAAKRSTKVPRSLPAVSPWAVRQLSGTSSSDVHRHSRRPLTGSMDHRARRLPRRAGASVDGVMDRGATKPFRRSAATARARARARIETIMFMVHLLWSGRPSGRFPEVRRVRRPSGKRSARTARTIDCDCRLAWGFRIPECELRGADQGFAGPRRVGTGPSRSQAPTCLAAVRSRECADISAEAPDRDAAATTCASADRQDPSSPGYEPPSRLNVELSPTRVRHGRQSGRSGQ